MRYFLEIAFDGKPYLGWQIQAEGITVQSEVNRVLTTILREKIYSMGCGRTDTGVHAKQFILHFDTKQAIEDIPQFLIRFNGFAPHSIAAFKLFEVGPEVHARFSALTRTYEYWITFRKDPFLNKRATRLYKKPDLNIMNQACEILLGKKDFKAFSKVNELNNHLCDLTIAKVEEEKNMLKFTFTANRFLRNMVRAMVGTLLDIGYGKITLEELQEILASKNRSNAGHSVAAEGLYLTQITYPFSIPD